MNSSSESHAAFLREIAALTSAGQKIEAIKRVRERYGVGLKEAKDLVDGLEAGRQAEIELALSTFASSAPPPATDFPGEVRRLLADGKKIEAIKRVREQTGLGLKEAKDLVEAYEAGQPVDFGRAAMPQPTPQTDGSAWAEIDNLVRAGNKIEAIKLHRQTFGTGLAEAKAAIDARVPSTFPQTQFPAQADEPQTLAQRLGIPGIVIGLIGVLIFLTMCVLLSYAVWGALAG